MSAGCCKSDEVNELGHVEQCLFCTDIKETSFQDAVKNRPKQTHERAEEDVALDAATVEHREGVPDQRHSNAERSVPSISISIDLHRLSFVVVENREVLTPQVAEA